MDRKTLFKDIRRVVVKLGTTVITRQDNLLDQDVIRRLSEEISGLRRRGMQVAVVSSGAISAGMGRLGMKRRPVTIPDLQAAAAVGQNLLMHNYKIAFREYGITIAQVLLTADDLKDRPRYVNARNTLAALFKYGVVPVLNANDSVAMDEIKVGDNDTLAAYVTNLIEAQLLVILSDVDGLYSGDPGRGVQSENDHSLIEVVEEIDDKFESFCGGPGSDVGVGGFKAKIRAARIVTMSGEMLVIANGKRHSLSEIVQGENIGTLFLPVRKKMTGRKRWIAFAIGGEGSLIVDPGAVRAIVKGGKSLLPSGIVGIRGNFDAGEMVKIEDESGRELARGLARYSCAEVDKIRGRRSSEIEDALGYRRDDEVIHRDDIVVLV